MTTRCPLVSLPEWKLLVNSIGEDEAYRVFIANGEEIPTIEEVNELIRISVNDARGEFHDNSWNEGMETGDLPMPINYDAIVLTPEHTAHYINIGSAALDDDYIRRKAKGQNIINIDEAKNGFIKGFQSYIDTVSPEDKKPLNIAFLEEVKKDNSELWEAIKNNQSRKYYYKEEKYNGDIEEKVKTANWSEVKEVSTEKSVLEAVKRTINRLKKRLPVELDSKGNISETLSSSDTNTFSGLPERLEYKDYAGGLFLKYLGCETMSDILDRTKQIALYHPSFNELLQILKDDEDLLAAFYMNILRQAKQAKIILKTNKTINVTLEGISFTQKMADRLNGMVLNQIKSGSFYTQELKEELTKAEYRLFTVKDGIKQSVDRDKAISIVNTIYKKLGIQINDEDIVNLFRTHELEDITNQLNTIIHGLINGESNLFARSEAFKKLEETRLNLNNSLLDATIQLSSSIDFEKEKDLKKLLIEIEKNIIVNKKEIKKFDIGSKGRLFDLSSLIEKVRIDIPDTITTNIKNKQKSMIQWNDFVSNFFNVLQNNPVEGEKILLDLIGYNYTTGSISSRSANYSEIFLGKNGLLKVVKDETKSSGTKIVLNTEVVKDFDYNEDGGIKDVFTNNAQEYDDFNKKDYIAKMLLYHINTKEGKTHLTSQFMPTPSDSGTTKIVTMRKWEVSANDYGALQATDGYDYIKGTKWFNAIWKTVLQEIVSMEDAFNIMFDKNVYLDTGKLQLLDSVKNGETVLSLNYHYKLKDGVPSYVDSKGNPTGDVFKFMNFYYKVDGKRLTLNNINDNKVVFLNQVIQNNNLTEFGNKYKLATYEFAKWHIDIHEELYKDYANEIDKDLITKSNKQYGNIVAELAINNYLAKIAMQDLFGDTLNDVGKTINVYKRSKKSPGATYGVYKDKKSEGYMSIEIDDIVKDIVIDAKKGIRLENVTVSDGMSIISREEKLNRLKRQGKYKDYKKARDAYEAGDNSVIDAITLNQDKNFYYNYFYNPVTKRRESELVKNSDLTVTASVFEGSQLEDLMNLVSKLEKEFGQGVQLNFKSSKKKGNSNSIVRLHDENGNLALTEDTYNQLKKAATPQYYRNLVKVQDTSSHIVDNDILLGTQIAKSIITNLNGDSSGSYFNDSMNGETLIKEFFNIIDSNLAEASQELLDRIKDEEGNVTLKSLSDLLLKEAIDKNWDSNLIKGLQTVEGELNMPLFYSVYDKKIQEFLTSLWTNKITKQRHSGYHAFQAPNIFMGNSTSKVTGGKRKLGEITESSYIGKVNYLKSKDKDRSLKCISLNKGKILKMEVLVSRWDSKFKDLNGKPIDINDLDPSVLTSIGFRIPTEGKFSTFIFDVVGFLPDEMEGTIVVPDGFTGITGSDFDIDSIYVMTQNLTNDIKVDKYLDNSNSTLLERYEKFEAEQKAKAAIDKELENKIKKTIKQSNYEFYTEDLVKAKSDYLKWFNTKYEQDVKYFYQIEKVLDSIIKQLHLELDIINTQINDRDASASDVKWHKINETAKLAILTEAVKDDNALLKFSKTALTIDEKTLKDREESIKLEKEKVIVEQSNFANYPISRQNTRKARENRIFDIFAEVLTNPSSFEEITTSSEYQELVDATADVNKSVEEYNPNILKDSIEMTSNILSNKNLKGNAVNFSNLAQISNVAKIQSKVGVSYKASKSEVAAGMTEFSYFDHIGIIRTEDGWQDRNFAGHFITSYTSKVVANIMDAVANPMAANMNEYTLNVYSIFPAFGVPNYKYPTYFISQGVVTELIKVVENKGVFYTNNEESEFTIVRNKIHKVLRLLSSLDGTLTEEETNAFMIAAQSGTVENLTKAQKDFNLKNHTQTTNKFDYDELLSDVEFFQKTNKVFDLVEILKNAVDNNATDEFINYVNKTGTTNLKNYLIRQLSILEEFQTLKNLGKDLVSLSSLLKFDRNGAGPELDVNKKTLNNLDKAAYSEEFGFLIDEENAIQAIYPTLYGTGKESAYKHLESKLLYGNLNSYDTLAPFFIQETPFLRNVLNDYEVDWAREGMKQEIRRSLLLDLEFFKTSKETRKKVLGINTPFVADLDVLDNSVSNFEDFKDLSAANQLYLIQKQYASLFSTPFETHLLSELSFDERTLDEEEFNFKKITRQNLNDKEKFSYQLGLMLSNKNKFVKELAENLIRYTFFTNGWSYGNNLASVVPMEYITGERARQLGLDISGHLKEKMVKAKTGSNVFLASDIVGNYHRRNWRNNELVVEVKNKVVINTTTGEEDIAPYTPNWSEHDLNGFIYLSDMERDFIKNPKVANAKFIKVKQADFSFKIYRAKAVKVINSKGKLEQIGVSYIGVNKLETWEDDDTSLIETNNNSTFDSVKYDEFLTAAQDAFTADEAAKNAFSNEKDFVNYKQGDLFEENNKDIVAKSFEEITNHSGGAVGADSGFDKIGKQFGQSKHIHYFYGNKTPLGNRLLNQQEVNEGIVEMKKAAKILGKNPQKADTINLLARNWFQVKNSTQIVAIAPIDETMKFVEGGTGWAVAMAQGTSREINVYNLKDNKWYKWNGNKFVSSEIPVLHKNFAGIGSRQDGGKMTQESIQAIIDVYDKTKLSFLNNTKTEEEFTPYEDVTNSQESSPIKENLLLEQNNEINKVTEEEDIKDIEIEDNINKDDITTINETANETTSTEDKKSITLNKEQEAAVKEAIDFIENGNPDEFFVVEGKAGTGKTTIVQYLVKEFPNKNIKIATLANAAKKVVKSKFTKHTSNVSFHSIASLLGQKLNMETGEFEKAKTSGKYEEDAPIEWADIVIIDEGSMLNEQALEIIFEEKPKSTKVIFLGDIGQLPPIRTTINKFYKGKEDLFGLKSPVFNFDASYDWWVKKNPKHTLAKKVKLIERVRQGEDSPILPYADYYWENSQVKNPVEIPADITTRKNVINSKGALIFVNKFNDIRYLIVDYYKKAVETKNPDFVKMVVYRNETRIELNKSIHKSLFGLNSNPYNVGELMMFNAPYGKTDNATQIQLTQVDKVETDVNGLNYTRLHYIHPDDNLAASALVLNEDSVARHKELVSIAFQEAFSAKGTQNYYNLLKDAWQLKDKYADLDYAYAITSHKSQGSTYDIVIVGEKDIMGVSSAYVSDKSKSESIYTALTRARNVAIVVSAISVEDTVIDKDALNYDNIILDSDIKSTPDARLIETTKKATARILRIIDTHAFYGSFQAQKTVKGLVVKPIMSYTEAELEYVYLQIGFVNKFVFDDLGISTSGGFHSKTLTERRNIVVHLVNKYKREIEKTPKGITNKIRIPHKDINKITDLELLYNVSGIASHVISRVHYVQQEVNRWSEARKEGYKVGGVNTLYKPEEVYDLEQINRLSKLINHINSIKDIMVELDSVKWVNEGTGLTQTQIGINYIILTMNEYRDQLNNIVNDSRKLYSAYLKGVIEQTTEDPALLADASEMSKAIEKAINSIKDSTQFQLMLDSPKDSTNVILGNLIKKWNVQKNMELLKANAMKNYFVKLLEATNGNYEDIFEKTKSGQRTGRIVETSLLQDDNLKALAEFITNQLGVITQDTNKNNIVDKGFLPALAILNKSNWKIIQEKLGYFDSFDRNTKVITDMDGNALKSVVQMYTSFIKPKHKIRIPYEKEADETNTEYDERLTDDILTVYGLSFKNRKQIEEYNKQVDNYNKLLNSAAHSENISYDLAKVIPLYITEAYQFNWKKLIENEFLMNIRMVSGMDFEVKMNTVETLVRRYTGVKKNQTKKGSATNAIKQLELWGHINIYNDFNASSAKETKWGRVLQQYTSMTGLGLNPFSGLNNVVYGSIQNKIHSVADGSFNVKDNTKAGKLYYNFNALCSYFTDKADDLKSSTLQSAIIKDIDIMNVQTEEVERAKTDISNNSFEGTASVALSGLFFFQHAGEHMMQNRLLFAMMYGARVIDGKILNWKEFVESRLQVAKITDDLDTVKAKSTKNKQTLKDLRIEFDSYKNLIDCYEFKDGVAVRSAEFSDLEMAKFKDKAKNKGQRLHGIYNKEDLAYMQKWVIGRWAMQFRRWMRPGWNKRFGSRFMQDSGFMESYGERDKGSFKSLWDFVATPIRQANESDRKMGNAFMSFTTILGDYSKFFMNVGAYANTLSYEEKAKVKQASIELANFALIILVLAFSRKLDDDNEELDESYMFAFYLNQLDRLKSELGGYQPFSVGGSGGWYNEGKKLLASPTATTTTGVNLIQVIAEIASLANGADEDEYFKSGVYSKRLKALVHLTKAVPILNQVQRAYYLPESNQFYRLYQ